MNTYFKNHTAEGAQKSSFQCKKNQKQNKTKIGQIVHEVGFCIIKMPHTRN